MLMTDHPAEESGVWLDAHKRPDGTSWYSLDSGALYILRRSQIAKVARLQLTLGYSQSFH